VPEQGRLPVLARLREEIDIERTVDALMGVTERQDFSEEMEGDCWLL
jgi:hypothetical protein